MNIKELINYGKNILNENNIEDSNIIARSLAEYILQMNREQIVINNEKEITDEEKTKYHLAIKEIAQGKPLQYITNKQEFMKLEFYVDENVLIPQPDTEVLVEEVIKIVSKIKSDIKILDICTGSGCIGVSLAKYIENANITMSDISSKALEIAKINCEKNIPTNNVKFIESDMFEKIEGKFDIIVSNPPYIETVEINTLDKQVQNEPKLALDGGKDGLQYYRILINEGYKYLNKNGYLCMEIGYNQKDAVIDLIKQSGKYTETYCKKDLEGNNRVIVGKGE